jgi:tetratricopeptide (TPR) repeat protein
MGSLKFGLGDFEASIPCLQHAVAINPLYARVWFTMGVSYVKLERWSDARDAFRRLVNVDEEDAEGWNNLAAVYLRIGEEGRNKDEVSTIRNLISTELISAPSTCLIRQQALGVQSTTTGSTTRSS